MIVPPHIETLFPYLPGKPIEETERELGIRVHAKLASNENPLGPGKQALAAAGEALKSAHLYPDGASYYLKEALAGHLGVPESDLVVGNGSNELLVLLVRTFLRPGVDEAVLADGSFIVYRLALQAHGVHGIRVPLCDRTFDLEAMAAAVTPKTRMVFIANPNNPTGTYVGRTDLEAFLEAVPDTVTVVLDEAYFEYVEEDDYPDGVALRARYPNLVVLRTFSKIHGLAGLRCGYAVVGPELAGYLDRVRDPFNVGSVSQAAARAALTDTAHVNESRRVNREGLVLLGERLEALGIAVTPSVANFVLADFHRDGGEVYEALLRRGVIVRPMKGYGFPKSARITVGLPEENARLFAALDEVFDR